jgi:hypothetical protein
VSAVRASRPWRLSVGTEPVPCSMRFTGRQARCCSIRSTWHCARGCIEARRLLPEEVCAAPQRRSGASVTDCAAALRCCAAPTTLLLLSATLDRQAPQDETTTRTVSATIKELKDRVSMAGPN